MAGISLNSNILSLRAQRSLDRSTEALGKSSERLSSGLRINRASDDAAGLAIAMGLNSSSRIYTQGIRNVNDAVSMLSIAEGAGREISTLLERLKELATQSASGSYSNAQRTAINSEAQALRAEANRIISVTEFNDLKLLDGTANGLDIQSGENSPTANRLTVGTDKLLSVTLGDGTFQAGVSFLAGDQAQSVASGDFNRDGFVDLVTASNIASNVNVLLGNGDGNYKARVNYSAGSYAEDVVTVDLNGDGYLDLATAASNDHTMNVLLGNGDGTFKAKISYAAGTGSSSISTADFDGDGDADLVVRSSTDSRLNVFINGGTGTFAAGVSYVDSGGSGGVEVSDVNGDGLVDILAVGSGSDAKLGVFFGNGNGTFRARVSYTTGTQPTELTLADINNDGYNDVLISCAQVTDAKIAVLLNNGNGTFATARSVHMLEGTTDVTSGDFNGDGNIDLASLSSFSSYIAINLGNGDGTFNFRTTISNQGANTDILAVDLNGDSVLDLATTSSAFPDIKVRSHIGNSTTYARMANISLATRSGALSALGTIDSAIDRVSQTLGQLGSQQSRLSFELRNLAQARENFQIAESRITNIDVAEESSSLVQNNILQQTAASILGQANVAPNLALILLR